MRHFKPGRQIPALFERDVHIMDRTASLAEKMGMFHQVCAVPGRSTIQIDLFDQTGRDQSLKTIIDGAQRNRWHVFLCAQKDLRGSRMVRFLHQHAQHLLALPGKPDTAGCQFLGYLAWKLHFYTVDSIENDIKNYSQ